jgi:hypothetical protein
MAEHSKLAFVQSIERNQDENGPIVEVIADTGGGTLLTLEHFDGAGEDSPPLPGDLVALDESTGQGAARAVGYADPKNAGTALAGEKRIFARDPDGTVVAEFWLRSSEKLIDVQGLSPGWRYRLGKLEIDENGNLTTPGEITAKAGTPAMVTLTQHTHPTGTGPSGPAIPGA